MTRLGCYGCDRSPAVGVLGLGEGPGGHGEVVGAHLGRPGLQLPRDHVHERRGAALGGHKRKGQQRELGAREGGPAAVLGLLPEGVEEGPRGVAQDRKGPGCLGQLRREQLRDATLQVLCRGRS